MNSFAYSLVGLTAIVAVLVAVLLFATLRFFAAAKDAKRHLREGGAETAFLSAALAEAVAKLKAQEQAMSARAEASERLSGEIVASLTAGLLVVDANGRVQILNPAGRRLLGLADGPAPPGYRELLTNADALADVIAECLSTGRSFVRRSIQIPAAAGPMHLGVTVSPLGSADGPHGAICLFSDLTAIVELEEQLRLKEALARLGELTAGLAHEFRNGLATIHGYARLIDPQGVPAPYGPYVEGIRQETEALGRVVTNFLSFAKPETLSLAPVDLESIARRGAEDIAHDFPGAAITVEGAFGTIDGDEVLLRQAFSNLIRNAVEACQGAGIPPAVAVKGSLDADEQTCRVAVEDNGPGIDPALQDRVFRPFFTTKGNGTGLGLAIVQKIVVTHNGRVAVRSRPGGGAVLQVTFPQVRT